MSSTQTITILAVALVGGLLGAVVMQYMGPVDLTALGIRKASRPAERPEAPARNDHDEHNPPKERNGHTEEQVVRLSEAERNEFGIEVGTADSGKLQMHLTLPGEVVLNADRRAQVVPRVPGVVRQVHKTLGEPVRAGEVMAVLESRELTDMKSAYLTAKERVALAEATFQREETLWKKNISPAQEYLEAKKALAEARIELRATQHKLHAMGFADTYLAQLPSSPDTTFTQYTITAPFDGTVIEKHVALGEVLKDDTLAFVVADLRSVWVDLRVYQQDLPSIRKGQPVVLAAGQGIPDAQSTIAYIGPLVGEQTRTALARVILPNPDGYWRPGLFVTGKTVVKDIDVSVLVPKTVLQTIDERPVVFVETAAGFQPQPVTLGRSNETHVEVTAGLTPGQRYVTNGAFTLKAPLAKSTFGDEHGH
jgi:cobalt-zinc-cadmium efflux system membrane fusion protein